MHILLYNNIDEYSTLTYQGVEKMENYGATLKKLIKFTNVKLSTVADAAGYDVSYISKWCNQSKLPAARVAGSINKNLSQIFASEIISQGELENFCNEFNVIVTEEQLSAYLHTLLKDTFKNTLSLNDKDVKKSEELRTKILYNPSEITRFMDSELPGLIASDSEPIEILCTMDISTMVNAQHLINEDYTSNRKIRIRMGINPKTLNGKKYLQLYYLINKYHWVSFDIYDNTAFGERNLIVVKNKLALLLSLDNRGNPTIVTVIHDKDIVNTLFTQTMALFKIHHVLIMATTSEELNLNGYRSNFYAFDDYQIFLTRGFEYLLPPNIVEKIVAAAYEQGYDSSTEKILRTLFDRWDEISHNGKMDFFFTKSGLLKYIDDGEFYFTDIIYRMTIDERKEHINYVLNIAKVNPNINFYVIDDEDIPYPNNLFSFSIFNNHSKLFLKNNRRFTGGSGPQFYTVLNETMIAEIGKCYEEIKHMDFCMNFPCTALESFMSQYGAMVYRMLSLSDIKSPYKKK